MKGCRSEWCLPDASGEANGGHWQRPADASAGHQRQMVGGGVKWQVALQGNGGKRWTFKPKAIGGLWMQMVAEASGGCQRQQKKENNQLEVAVMAAAGGGGSRRPMTKYPKKENRTTINRSWL